MKSHVIEIFLLLQFYTSNGIPRFHHHNPLKKHSSHTRAKSTSVKPQTDLCSGSTKQDATLIKQFYARTFTLFRNEKPGCVCIQLCKGKPAYCYPDGCFHSLGGCNGKTTIPKPTDNSKKAGTVPERKSETDSKIIQSRNSLSTQGDFNKKFQSNVNNKQTGDQIKKRENDSFLTDDKDKDISKEIPDVLVENYPSDLKILKLIDKDYTQWPKSKILQDTSYVNFTKWDLGELNIDEISTVSTIASSNTTNVPYALSDVGRQQVPSFNDFKQQFEMLSNSQQMPVFDDFFAETNKVIISNNPMTGTTLSGMHHQNVRESNDFYQKEEYALKEDLFEKIATSKPSESKDGHLGNFLPNKRDFADESVRDLYASEAFTELYNNYVKRFDKPKIVDDVESTKENDTPSLSSTMYKPQYLQPTPSNIRKTPNSNHKPIEDAIIDNGLYTEESQDIAKKLASVNGKISETDFNAIFHNYYGGNQTDPQIKNNFIISNNSNLSTPSTVLESDIDKNDELQNKTSPNDRILGIDEVMNSGNNAHRVTPKHKPKFSHRGIVLKSDPSHYEGGRNMTSNHKGTSNLPQVRFTNDYAQLKVRDARPTSQIYATIEKRPLQSKYQKERRFHQESKRHILSSTELSVQLTEIVTLVNNITSRPRNETNSKRRSNTNSRYFRRKRPGVPKSK